jgi:hypothetical protein
MAKKTKTASEPTLSSGAAPARTRKHAPAKRTITNPVVEDSPSTETTSTLAAMAAAITVSSPVVTKTPASDEIARLAYSYWEQRGCQGGSPEEDWLRAERELAARA